MKILVINDHLKSSGGAETFVRTFEKILKKRGHSVRVLGSKGGENFASFFSRWYSLKWYFKVKKTIKNFKPDVVHINNCARILSPSVISASTDSKIPTVMTLHDFHFVCHRLGGIYDPKRKNKTFPKHDCFFQDCLGYDEKIKDVPRNFWRKIKTSLHRRILKRSEAFFVAPSKVLAKSMEKSLEINVDVINNGVDIPQKETSYEKSILFVGELNKEKGFHLVAPILNKIKDWKVFVLGEGYLKKSLERKYKNLKFLGFRNPREYYEKASIAIIPSIWMENFSYSVLEAMSYGLCIIGSDIGGIPEQIKNKKTGLLFEKGSQEDFEKKLDYLLKNPGEIKRMGRNAREFARKNYGWEKIVEAYEKFYENIMKS